MFDEETIAHLHSGCALIVGVVGADGRPYAARGHGLTVVGLEPCIVRLLVDSADQALRGGLGDAARVAITTADVATLRSMQLKGRVVASCQGCGDDRMKHLQYRHDFFDDIVRTDRTPMELLEAWGDVAELQAFDIAVDEVFDQTPGPRAGAPVRGGS